MAAPEERIGDAERQHEIERLRRCTADGRLTLDEFAERVGDVYAARTQADLVRPTADLPDLSAAPALVERTSAVGVFSGARQSGRWRPARAFDAVAVVGSAQIDLCDAMVDGDLVIRAWAVLGGIEILVPEGVHVDLGGWAVFGSRDYRVRTAPLRPGTPVVRVDTRVVLGGVTVRTRPFTGAR
ncbi:MAG: DUF1707 and DUF2154 domain-containing protein [Acidimicrobiales bacterium]|nr:DUF1707 and DUF2154 domain-containing protein [Acidimicrobiales bacterium]MCB1014263.1 DUF1707 and DUF2154 domain-containing protein [Acidimicrobiales bacterium]MCB9373332.1 DUF1707 and DUF2154 domain-containing protein [Microthrixaceae bacterium]